MAKMMAVALPVIAIGAAAFTGGTSLGLLGADATGAGITSALMDAGAGADIVQASTFLPSLTTTLGAGALVGATGIKAAGEKEAGDEQKDLDNYEASEMQQNADNQMASAEQAEVQQNRATAYTLSNAAAAAAAGGGAVTDPSTQNVMQTIAGQGQLRAMTDLYNGQEAAQTDTEAAQAKIYGGSLASQAGTNNMFASILGGASSLYTKYGDDE